MQWCFKLVISLNDEHFIFSEHILYFYCICVFDRLEKYVNLLLPIFNQIADFLVLFPYLAG